MANYTKTKKKTNEHIYKGTGQICTKKHFCTKITKIKD